jgi:hypothetical protein
MPIILGLFNVQQDEWPRRYDGPSEGKEHWPQQRPRKRLQDGEGCRQQEGVFPEQRSLPGDFLDDLRSCAPFSAVARDADARVLQEIPHPIRPSPVGRQHEHGVPDAPARQEHFAW